MKLPVFCRARWLERCGFREVTAVRNEASRCSRGGDSPRSAVAMVTRTPPCPSTPTSRPAGTSLRESYPAEASMENLPVNQYCQRSTHVRYPVEDRRVCVCVCVYDCVCCYECFCSSTLVKMLELVSAFSAMLVLSLSLSLSYICLLLIVFNFCSHKALASLLISP